MLRIFIGTIFYFVVTGEILTFDELPTNINIALLIYLFIQVKEFGTEIAFMS